MQKICRALCVGGGAENRPRVFLQDREPALDIGGVVCARLGRQLQIGAKKILGMSHKQSLVMASGYGIPPFLADKSPYFAMPRYSGLYAPNPYFDRDLSVVKLADKMDSALPSQGHLSEFIEPALQFLANPWNPCKKGDFAMQQTVLRLTFAETLRYSRNEGYRTAKTTFPFKVLSGVSTQKCEMVDLSGEDLNLLFQVLEEWETHLAQYDLDDLRCDDEYN